MRKIETGSIPFRHRPLAGPDGKGLPPDATVGWLHGREASSYSPPGANYGGPVATPQLELPGGGRGQAPYPIRVLCTRPRYARPICRCLSGSAGQWRVNLYVRRGGGRTRGT